MSEQQSQKLRRKKRTIKLVALVAIAAVAGGAAIGLTAGYIGGSSSATDTVALSTFGLPSVPDGFAPQTILDAPTVEESEDTYADATKELTDELSTAFGLKFDEGAAPAAAAMFSADGQTQTLAQSVTGRAFTAINQGIPVDRRQEAVDIINNVVQRHGFKPFSTQPIPQPEGAEQISPLSSDSVSIMGVSEKSQLEQYHVDIVSALPLEGTEPIQTVVVYFTSAPHLYAKDVQAFKDAALSDYRVLTGGK